MKILLLTLLSAAFVQGVPYGHPLNMFYSPWIVPQQPMVFYYYPHQLAWNVQAGTVGPRRGGFEAFSKENAKVVLRYAAGQALQPATVYNSENYLHLKEHVQETPAVRNQRFFGYFDINGDGKISAIEVRFADAQLGTNPDQLDSVEENQEIIDAFDRDNDGKMEFEEFVAFLEDYISKIFAGYDLNGDDTVSSQELYAVQSDLQTDGEILPAESYQTVITVVEIWMAGLPHYQGEADNQWDLQEFTAFLFGSIGEWGHS